MTYRCLGGWALTALAITDKHGMIYDHSLLTKTTPTPTARELSWTTYRVFFKSIMFWFQLQIFFLLLGIEEDFKFWSSDFLQQVKNERGNLKETACHCATESQSSGCHSQEDFQENGTQDDEVHCTQPQCVASYSKSNKL